MSEITDTGNAATGVATAIDDGDGTLELSISVDDIEIPAHRERGLGDTKLLEQSLKTDGLLQRIRVRLNPDFEDDDTGKAKPYILVYGLHRLRAAQNVGWAEIPAKVGDLSFDDAKIHEVVENLIRHDLSAIEKMKHLEIYQKHYNSKWGISPGKAGLDDEGNKLPRFEERASEILGEQAKTIRENIAISKKIDDGAAEILKDTKAGNTKDELRRLANFDPETQQMVAEKLFESEAAGENMSVLRAADLVAGREPSAPTSGAVETPAERFIKVLDKIDGSSRLLLRTLRDDIPNQKSQWPEQTRLDFVSQILDIRNTMDKVYDILSPDTD